MSAVTKLRDQVKIARESGTFVVLTPDEAQAVVDAAGAVPERAEIRCDRCGHGAVVTFSGARAALPTIFGDDEHV
jgi:flavin reductase (DIM6/NTAB) family NADH-FMN oxidoreductase RutF